VSNRISSTINSQLITRLSQVAGVKAARSGGSSDVKFSTADQVSRTLNAGGRTFAKAFTSLNTAANFVNIGIDTLKQLDRIVSKVITLAEKASRFGSGSGERANLSSEYRRLSGQFSRILQAADKSGEFNPLSEKDIENVLVNVGIDKERSLELASIFKKLRLVAGSPSLADDKVRDPRSIQSVSEDSESGSGGGGGSSGNSAVERVSTSTSGATANGVSTRASISSDGRYVAFESEASNLATGDTNSLMDVFVKDRQTGTTTRVSTDSSGAQSNGASSGASVSTDGRYITFTSDATDLVASDTNGAADIFIKDTVTGTTSRVSTNTSGSQANSSSGSSYMTPDGRYVFFNSLASDLVAGDTNGVEDVFRKDLQTGTTIRVSEGTGGIQGDDFSSMASSGIRASDDGRYVVFTSGATNLVAGDSNFSTDVFVKDLDTGTLTIASKDSGGLGMGIGLPGMSDSAEGRITSDGTKVSFSSIASDLVLDDTNSAQDVFVKDLTADTITLVSATSSGTIGDAESSDGFIASDGQHVAFTSVASNLASSDTNSAYDVFLKNIQTGSISRVSRDANDAQLSSDSYTQGMSADGRYIAFDTDSAIDASDSNALADLAVVDTQFTGGGAPTSSGGGNVRRFNRVFEPGRMMRSRDDARVLAADAKFLQKNIRTNIKTLEGVAQNVIDNMELVRTTALTMLDGARDPTLLSLKDSARVAETIRSQILAQGKPAALRQVDNLNSILAVSLINA
jgi:hypothetical protein